MFKKNISTISDWSDEFAFLRNDWPVTINMAGMSYPSVEHAFQAAKTNDIAIRQNISANHITAREAKKIGRNVEIPDNWEEIKLDLMEGLVRQKFDEPELRNSLLQTGDSELVMAGGGQFWGTNPDRSGTNHLGKILMKIRREHALINGTVSQKEELAFRVQNYLETKIDDNLTCYLSDLIMTAEAIIKYQGDSYLVDLQVTLDDIELAVDELENG